MENNFEPKKTFEKEDVLHPEKEPIFTDDLTPPMEKDPFTEEKSMDDPVNIKGELSYDDKVIQKIIAHAVEQIDGLLTVDGGFFSNIAEKLVNTENVTAGIEAEVGKEQVAVDMDVVIEYGKDIPKICDEIKRVIHDNVEKMTHLDVIEVNVHVSDIKTQKEFADSQETVQDKVTNVAKTTGHFAAKQTNKAKDAINRGTNAAQEKIDDAREPRVR